MPKVNTNSYLSVGEILTKDQSGPTQSFNLGTSWGEAKEDKVVGVSFEDDGTYDEMSILYSTREGLEAMGVSLVKQKEVFPEAFGEPEFCPQPFNWSQ